MRSSAACVIAVSRSLKASFQRLRTARTWPRRNQAFQPWGSRVMASLSSLSASTQSPSCAELPGGNAQIRGVRLAAHGLRQSPTCGGNVVQSRHLIMQVFPEDRLFDPRTALRGRARRMGGRSQMKAESELIESMVEVGHVDGPDHFRRHRRR